MFRPWQAVLFRPGDRVEYTRHPPHEHTVHVGRVIAPKKNRDVITAELLAISHWLDRYAAGEVPWVDFTAGTVRVNVTEEHAGKDLFGVSIIGNIGVRTVAASRLRKLRGE